jgi:hypothetical protein
MQPAARRRVFRQSGLQSEHPMRTFTIVIFLAMLTGTAVAQDSPAPAPGNAPPPPTTQSPPLVSGNSTNGLGSVWQAPVGHRQPTLNGLPPAVRHDERSEADGQRVVDPFANVPNICSGC